MSKVQDDSTSPIMPQVIISAQQLTQKIELPHQTLTIFENLNLNIYTGEQVAITGRSGSGKSTLLGILATLDQASAGQLSVCGEAIEHLNEEQRALIRLQYIGFVFQSFQLLPHLSALENVMLPLRLQKNFNYAHAEQKSLSLLAKVGLERQSQQTPKVLSGGEQQRVAIARALISDPKIIFADEPTGNLDPESADSLMKILHELPKQGKAGIMVTHNHAFLKKYPGRVFLFEDGKVTEQIEQGIDLIS